MGKLVAIRLVWVLPTLIFVTFLVFVMLDLAPGDAARTIAGENARPEQIEEIRQRLDLDSPVITRYFGWAADAFRGDLQTSLVTDREVTTQISNALPQTMSLVAVSLVISMILALMLGALPVLFRTPIVDRIATFVSSITISMPSFWAALLLASAFAVDRRWFPALGYTPFGESAWEWLRHLILPATALAMLTGGELARQLRGSLRDVMQRDYTLAAYARGVPYRRVVLKHGLKNAAIPVVTVLGIRTAQLLGGTVIIESIFLIDGVGRLTVTAVFQRDIPIVLGVVVVTTVIVLIANVLVDLSYTYFNPRARVA